MQSRKNTNNKLKRDHHVYNFRLLNGGHLHFVAYELVNYAILVSIVAWVRSYAYACVYEARNEKARERGNSRETLENVFHVVAMKCEVSESRKIRFQFHFHLNRNSRIK